MKALHLLIGLMILWITPSNGQGLMEGQSFTYHFDVSDQPTQITLGRESYLLLLNHTGGSVVYEFFEGQPIGSPAQAGVFGGAPYVTLFLGLWEDGEGTFRLTAMGGPANFSDTFIHLTLGGDAPNIPYVEFAVPIPEPSSAVLFVLGFLGLQTLLGRRRGKQNSY
jgi:hypothetical protein